MPCLIFYHNVLNGEKKSTPNHINIKRKTMEPCIPYSLESFDNFLLLQRVISKEKMEGRRLVSSIESLAFSVTSEDDIAITVKDVEGCQLDESVSQLVIFSFSI